MATLRRLLASILFCAMSSFALANPLPDEPCVPDGGSSEVCADRPDLIGDGMPVGSIWAGGGTGNPAAYEDDPLSPDDPMGAATSGDGGETGCATISNSGGNLRGPNGEQQNNGGGEGACIEVKICWTSFYPVTKTSGYRSEGGSTSGESVTVWRRMRICTPPKTICPC